jgi:hypothetical protein
LDNLVEVQFEKLSYIYKWAEKNNAIVCQGGDLVHKPRSWYLLPLVTKFFLNWKIRGVETIMCRGQHDYYFYSEASGPATVIGALAEGKLLRVLEGNKPIVLDLDGEQINLYGASFGQRVPTPPKYSDGNILLVHREITDTELFPGHKYYSHTGFLKRHKNFKIILAADIHRKFKARILSTQKKVERWIVNTGPMTRQTATHYNFQHKPGFYIWTPKTKKLNWKLIPSKPADEILTRAHIEAREEADREMAKFTLILQKRSPIDGIGIDRPTQGTFNSNLEEYLDEHKVSRDVADVIYGSLQAIDLNDL